MMRPVDEPSQILPFDSINRASVPLSSSLLILVPTQKERSLLEDYLPDDVASPQLCGFGPIAAAAETSRLLAEWRPTRLCLIGIAGSYDPTLTPVGSAHYFRHLGCWGVGAGEGTATIGAKEMGIPQWQDASQSIYDRITLAGDTSQSEARRHKLLLTCCRAATSQEEVKQRRQAFPDAVAEDMEAFGVALAALRQSVPMTVIRGISNLAGDRNHKNWSIAAALQAAARLLVDQVLNESA